MTTEFIPHTTDEAWLALRRTAINSTESPALFGLSPYATAYEVWHRKRGTLPDDFGDNDRMQAGRHIEPAIASLLAERYGVVVEPFKDYALDREDRMGSSFDFLVVDLAPTRGAEHALNEISRNYLQHGNGILECKNVDFLAHRDRWTEDECPDHIEIQLQHQLELADLEWGAIAALVGGNTLWLYVRMRDRAVGRGLRKRIAEFWKSQDDNAEPDPIMPDDAEAVISMYQYADPDTVFSALGDDVFAAKMLEYKRLGDEIKERHKKLETIKAETLMIVGSAARVVTDAGNICLTQVKPCHVEYDREGYRMFRFTPKKQATK